MTEDTTSESSDTALENRETTTTKAIAGKINPVQSAIEMLEDELPPTLIRKLDHLKGALATIEDWADDAEPHDIDALVGAKTIIDAEQQRVEDLRSQAGSGQTAVIQKFEKVTDRLSDLKDTVEPLTFTTTAYVVYVNGQFVARYSDGDVTVETLLEDAGKEDPDELGLFPLDGFNGDRQTDQAFPADQDLDLSDEHRTFFESTSDGGKIA
ncbi:hypothetical protein JMJ58_05370 [Haloterrigena salifodinae]|uniref:Uncharacterized protein n=1 Tax=Haloterrigena salifodinae TaxID=2675099 RepID=A0A8T8E430_9EURY|nr:hypothetical protein [Haloterrigena salifodinae]QRV16323.1 hypothetical protein JMJ58_05370 [Haloterrigena salifodinae]